MTLIRSIPDNHSLQHLLQSILNTIETISKNLRLNAFKTHQNGVQNDFGDSQLDADVEIDKLMFDCLKQSQVVSFAVSEETPVMVNCRPQQKHIKLDDDLEYIVAFDPLDGSSIVDANFAVGTVMGVWAGDTLIGRTGRDMIASMMVMYGPKTTVAIGLNLKQIQTTADIPWISFEMVLEGKEWMDSKVFQIAPLATHFGPGNLRGINDNPSYERIVMYWIRNGYTLRYTGGVVPDTYHILSKGQGVTSNVASPSTKEKLRLVS